MAAVAVEPVNIGASQVKATRMPGIAPSAVSHYPSGKRGYRIVFDGTIRELITELARDLKSGPVDNLVHHM